MSLLSIDDAVLEFLQLKLQGKEFNVSLQVSNEWDDWSFQDKGVMLERCRFTDFNETITPAGAATSTFSGLALAIQVGGVSYSTYPDNS